MRAWLYVRLRGKVRTDMTDDAPQVADDAEDLAEGYPSIAQVVRGILGSDDLPERGVYRIEINCFASGDATYRAYIVGRDDPEGGYLDQL